MSRKNTITADQAFLPKAIPAAQRRLPGEIAYPLFSKFGDWWAGRTDMPTLKPMFEATSGIGLTPWMEGLRAGFLTALARDRRDTTVLQAPLREEAMEVIARRRVLEAKSASLKAAQTETKNAQPSDQPTTAGEANESPTQLLQRRRREAATQAAATAAAVSQCEGERETLRVRHAQLTEAHAFHEAAYSHRAEALRDHYAKRQAVYLRRGLKGVVFGGPAPSIPQVDIPDWQAEAFPVLPSGGKP